MASTCSTNSGFQEINTSPLQETYGFSDPEASRSYGTALRNSASLSHPRWEEVFTPIFLHANITTINDCF